MNVFIQHDVKLINFKHRFGMFFCVSFYFQLVLQSKYTAKKKVRRLDGTGKVFLCHFNRGRR